MFKFVGRHPLVFLGLALVVATLASGFQLAHEGYEMYGPPTSSDPNIIWREQYHREETATAGFAIGVATALPIALIVGLVGAIAIQIFRPRS